MSSDIAIIDSGVNPWHSHVNGVERGLSISLDARGEVITSADFTDEIGHGTAIAGIIKEKSPKARLYAIKIFFKELSAPSSVLLAALEWAINEGVKIIHLSLGTEREECRSGLDELCQCAYDRGTVLVASARGPNDKVYPAAFDTVIGVYWDKNCGKDALIYRPKSLVKFGAYGWPRSLPGLPQDMNFHGNSFAAAHVSARVAKLLEENPHVGTSQIKGMLINTGLEMQGI
jgi:subtilisin family serine protease